MNQYPKGQRFSSRRPMQPVCRKCGRGWGSTFDGICTNCRGCTAHEAEQRAVRDALRGWDK